MSHPAVIGNRSGSDPHLNARLREVLAALVEVHRETAHAVGAETLARAAMAGWSRAGSVLRAVESRTPLDRLMARSVEGQVAVRVGVDEDRALAGCSLVSYALPGSVRGAVGVLGPLGMDYAHSLAVVDRVGSRLADLL
jgi:transcriptional regulator of heat shock response